MIFYLAYGLMVAYGQTVNKNNNNNRSLERWIFSMNSINKNNKKGFTIIEVVLVLAIAGLIFLMVFLALPALQRSQRDTQRKNDLSRILAAVNEYRAANKGKLPSNQGEATLGDFPKEDKGATGFVKNYLFKDGQEMKDPSGRNYAVYDRTPHKLEYNDYFKYVDIEWSANGVCDPDQPDGVRREEGNKGKVALRIVLEAGGFYCVNN